MSKRSWFYRLFFESGYEVENLENQNRLYFQQLMVLKDSVQKYEIAIKQAKQINDDLHAFGTQQIKNIRHEGVLLPSLIKWSDRLQEELDRKRSQHAESVYPYAPMASVRVREVTARARIAESVCKELENRIALYEAQAPWLCEYTGLTVEEVLEGLRLDEDLTQIQEQDVDPVEVFLSKGEMSSMDPAARNQLALDRFLDRTRARSAWAAGIEYERYIGFCYEEDGWSVEYHGAIKGRKDLGIDLICKRADQTLVIQCKRLSEVKGIPVRENTVGQLYGSTIFLSFERKLPVENVRSVLVTTFELSDTARRFAGALGVTVKEGETLKSYPRIKCNISKSGERIYHLPFDQQYDRTIIDKSAGEKYAFTIAEAEASGFRRAFRWRGA